MRRIVSPRRARQEPMAAMTPPTAMGVATKLAIRRVLSTKLFGTTTRLTPPKIVPKMMYPIAAIQGLDGRRKGSTQEWKPSSMRTCSRNSPSSSTINSSMAVICMLEICRPLQNENFHSCCTYSFPIDFAGFTTISIIHSRFLSG